MESDKLGWKAFEKVSTFETGRYLRALRAKETAEDKVDCLACGAPLGRIKRDWFDREYHLDCWENAHQRYTVRCPLIPTEAKAQRTSTSEVDSTLNRQAQARSNRSYLQYFKETLQKIEEDSKQD
jgi:hypothetical protein